MTVETNPTNVVEAEAETEEHHYVRNTTKRVAGLYGHVKNSSSLIKSSLETVESRIPMMWIERFTSARDPVIDKLDNQIEKVIKPVKELSNVSVTDVTGAVAARTRTLYTATEDKIGQWKSLRGDLSKKAVDRLERGLAAAKEFSANKGKDMIHFDLIAYSKEVLDNANAAAKPIYEPLQENMAAAIVKLNDAVTSLQVIVAARSVQTTEQYEAVRADLTARLHTAMNAARELSVTSIAYIQQKHSHLVSHIPPEYTPDLLASHLPYPMDAAVLFILHSPHLFLEVISKADITTSKRAIDNIQDLLAAVKEVVVPAILGGSKSVRVAAAAESEGVAAA